MHEFRTTRLCFPISIDIGKIFAKDILHKSNVQSLWLQRICRIVSEAKRLNGHALFIRRSGNWDPQSDARGIPSGTPHPRFDTTARGISSCGNAAS
jgi:hypothetical protein